LLHSLVRLRRALVRLAVTLAVARGGLLRVLSGGVVLGNRRLLRLLHSGWRGASTQVHALLS